MLFSFPKPQVGERREGAEIVAVDLVEGDLATAVVKSTSVMIEVSPA